jgi:hypothetical protein
MTAQRRTIMSTPVASRMRTVLFVAIFAAGSIALPLTARASTLPPTLTGEFLSALVGSVPASVDIVADCNPTGTSTVAWSATGQAFGPYAGTFVETGSATVGAQDGSAGYVNGIALTSQLSIDVFFSIDSPTGQVIGSKHLTTTTAFKQGACRDLDHFLLPDGSTTVTGTFRRIVGQYGSYDAIIVANDAAYVDSGAADVFLEHFAGTGMAEIDSVQESFNSALSGVTPASGGRATGGGRVGDVTFGFTALSDKSGPKGRCAIVDASADVMVKCTDVALVAVVGNKATVTGHALFNDVAVTYRMVVIDVAESGAGADSWSISLSNGYTAGGTLTEGNVQVSAR